MKPEAFLTRIASPVVQARARPPPGSPSARRTRGLARALLAGCLRWSRQGRISRVKQGVFVRLDKPGALNEAPRDFIALASRMAPDAAVAYHTALEAHGFAQSLFERLTFITWTKAKPLAFQGRRFVTVRPRAGLLAADRGEHWIERLERAGMELRVTNAERTVVDVLDRAGDVRFERATLNDERALDG